MACRARILGSVVALVLVASACTGDDGEEPTATSNASIGPTTTEAYPRWVVQETGEGYRIDGGTYQVSVDADDGLAVGVVDASGDTIVADRPAGGLFIVRAGTEHGIEEVTDTALGVDHVTFEVSFGAGGTGRVELAAEGSRGLVVRVSPDDPAAVTGWGTRLALQPGELIYGLTERIVDDWNASENGPAEVGSLDRRGEDVTMEVRPTMSGDVPFHQSSAGYGLLVDGTMPGSYAIGTDDPDVLSFRFEMDPDEATGAYHLLLGPDHAAILEQYHELAG